MNRVEFMEQLEQLLQDLPANDREDAITYYNDYFDEAGQENEAQVIRELGSPGKVAAIIKADLESGEAQEEQKKETPGARYQAPKKKNNLPWALIIVLIIFASPIILGVGGGLIGTVVGVFTAIVGCIAALLACGVALVFAGIVLFIFGIVRMFVNTLEALVTIGIGSLMIAFGLVLLVLFFWIVCRWIPALFRGCINLFQRLFHKNRKEA